MDDPGARCDLGLVGLGTMGTALAGNLEEHGHSVALFNRTTAKTEALLRRNPGKRFAAAADLPALVAAVSRPRRILLMVPAGAPVDAMIDTLSPHLDSGDILIDGGNSHYRDTERRIAAAAGRYRFLGMGISGGEEGARHGPSLMPGGDRAAYESIRPVLESIAAVSDSGPCVAHVGANGAGHFVKMVHNGIEYGLMQLIAESWDLMRHGLGLEPAAIAGHFDAWNGAELQSFLLEITAHIVDFPDDRGDGLLLGRIVDAAAQKGTGAWTSIAAGELSVPVSTITAAVEARNLSALRGERERAAGRFPPTRTGPGGNPEEIVPALRAALYAAGICAYAQGFALIRAASDRFGYGVEPREVARIWKAGCIIRAALLDPIMAGFDSDPALPNLLLDEPIARRVEERIDGWERAVTFAVERGIPIPALTSALAYLHTYRRARGSAALIQAQRDYFGAHTYERTDRPGSFHTRWN